MTYESKYHWNDHTLDYFNHQMTIKSARQVYEEIQEFVECECNTEDNETEEMLIEDLYRQIYK